MWEFLPYILICAVPLILIVLYDVVKHIWGAEHEEREEKIKRLEERIEELEREKARKKQ